jgi:methylenetetrahydrofolate dehydrogenase (NADP+)/methenyltetrahydrofolate cyclohydrolase
MDILEGKKIADAILKKLRDEIKREKISPSLAVILVGKNKASEIYVKLKFRRAKEIGINLSIFRFGDSVNEQKVISEIRKLNKNKKIHGIIVQLPLPKKLNTQKIINSISPMKDADGFFKKTDKLLPVFPQAIMKLIESSEEKISGKKAIVVANSKIFGETMKKTLEAKKVKAEYILAENISKNIDKIKKADILVSAIGKKGIIKGNIIKRGVIVIDGGITQKGKKVFGDVDFESVKNTARFISPVPGGVGPITIACLLQNVYLAAKIQK